MRETLKANAAALILVHDHLPRNVDPSSAIYNNNEYRSGMPIDRYFRPPLSGN
ncbi:MAG: hypothetical protein ACSLEL_00545 [Candidatus Malihini olakiniferum]